MTLHMARPYGLQVNQAGKLDLQQCKRRTFRAKVFALPRVAAGKSLARLELILERWAYDPRDGFKG
jgi:hypothetical protein